MTPYEQAQEMYHGVGQSFEQILTTYLVNHYVYCSPECFILAKPVETAWFIECAVGKNLMRRFFEMIPYTLPYVGFARGFRGHPEDFRNAKVRYYKIERLAALL